MGAFIAFWFSGADENMDRVNKSIFALLVLSLISLAGCQHLVIDTEKLVKSSVDLPEIVGLLAGCLGVTGSLVFDGEIRRS